jgi:hypothetical protein
MVRATPNWTRSRRAAWLPPRRDPRWPVVDLRTTLAQVFVAALVMIALPAAAQTSRTKWIADPNTNCQVWNPEPERNEAISWSGACANGQAQGRGILQWYRSGKPNGGRYDGEYRNGMMNGQGVYTFASGNRYEGEWQDGKRTGRGIFTWTNGNRFEGGWLDGKRSGWAVYTFDGKRYEGEYRNDRPNGPGTYTSADGAIYAGTWTNGCFQDGNRWAVIDATPRECGFK